MIEPVDDRLIVGDFDRVGPTIFLVLRSVEAVAWLHRKLTDIAMDQTDSVNLADEPRVRIRNVASFALERVDQRGFPDLRRLDRDEWLTRRAWRRLKQQTVIPRSDSAAHFRWAQTAEGWSESASLLEPFLKGHVGHEYLNGDQFDEALVEVSFQEPEVSLR